MSDLLDEISRLETEVHHPGVQCKPARLNELVHPSFFKVARSGRRLERDYVLAFLTQHEPPAVRSDDFRLTWIADDCVLLNYRSVQLRTDGSRFRYTLRASIWRRERSQWQLFYHQGTPVEEGW
ncbi:nuclear transport factor 2 family protein [Pseudomonas matsuisoli]|uniref:DUF4440 domain-containing protein n=1 Tax=Pseudomonas matsuisoli TaxID=1515666 RepID=A0A917UTP5_9PSED|nr:DUF4440 domain-containing protein [Pseudomonas matsuisoli]GGJ84764.1 hypothetical protein GCM10009304_08450 [Pseudomonas matsuisoli]